LRLLEIIVETFRNHNHSRLACARGGNVFTGKNGAGKTNLLEAISYLCLTKSFYAANDGVTTKIGNNRFSISGIMESDYGTTYSVSVEYNKETGTKTYIINHTKVEQASKAIGQFPVVIVSPEHSAITFGSPNDRRVFVDLALSQTHRSYLEQLLEYRRVVRQRNRILFHGKETGMFHGSELEPWNEFLIKTGSAITQKRSEFVEELTPQVVAAYEKLTGNNELPSIRYESSILIEHGFTLQDIEECYAKELHRRVREEHQTGYSLVGPHRDEFKFSINGLELRTYASQGQHKTFLVALKMAEFEYIRERQKETPLLLLDDILSELDAHRAERLLEYVATAGQYFLTSTDKGIFPQVLNSTENWQIVEIEEGGIRNVSVPAKISIN
jgi:DNA replication and repair protein RecF